MSTAIGSKELIRPHLKVLRQLADIRFGEASLPCQIERSHSALPQKPAKVGCAQPGFFHEILEALKGCSPPAGLIVLAIIAEDPAVYHILLCYI